MSQKKSKEKRKKHYFELIEKHEPIRPSELKNKYGIKRVREDYLKELVYEQKVKREQYAKRYTLLFLPGHKRKADERYRKDFNFNKHLENIKNKVIWPWFKQLKPIQNLSIESNHVNIQNKMLFKDFKKNHLKPEFNNPFEKLDEYNSIWGDMYLKKIHLYEHILYHIIDKEFDESPAELRYKEDPKLEFEKERFDFIDEKNSELLDVVDWIINLIIDFYPYFDEEAVNYVTSDLSSSVKEKDGFYEYYINEIYFGFIEKEKVDKEYFLQKMDECIKNILFQVQQSEKVQNQLDEIYEKQDELNSSIREMKETLEKYIHLAILPGKCEYY